MQQKNPNEIRNLTQQDFQTSNTVVTTAQQSISPIHPNLTTPRPKIQSYHK